MNRSCSVPRSALTDLRVPEALLAVGKIRSRVQSKPTHTEPTGGLKGRFYRKLLCRTLLVARQTCLKLRPVAGIHERRLPEGHPNRLREVMLTDGRELGDSCTTFRVSTTNHAVISSILKMPGVATILVVEDESGVRRLVAEVLSSEGYSVITVGSGDQALQAVEERPVDLLICDVNLPKLNGFAVAHQLESRYAGLKVLFISGHSCAITIGLNDRIDGHLFLRKPFTASELKSAVRSAFSGSRFFTTSA